MKLGEKELALRIFADVLAVQPDNVAASSGFAAASPEPESSAKTGHAEDTDDAIVIRNPTSAKTAIRYTLNGQYPVTLEPGTAQTLDTNRTWSIRFDEGNGGEAQERLEPGKYEFRAERDRTRLRRL